MAKTYTAVPDKAVRDQFTELMWDTYLRDNLNNLIVPPMARARHNANQVLTTAVLFSPVALNTEDFDTDSMHDTVTNNHRMTITTTGVYIFHWVCWFQSNATGYRFTYLFQNNGADVEYDASGYPPITGASTTVHGSVLAASASGEYWFLKALQNSGGNLNLESNGVESPMFSAVWVGRTS